MKKTNTILDKILEYKIKELELMKKKVPFNELKNLVEKSDYDKRNFKSAIKKPGNIFLIAEIKKASPSAGVIKKDFNHVKIAQEYEKAGADAVSVLTDKKFFQGDINFIKDIKKNMSLPVLRKDFIFDAYQLYESRLYGADAVLLITSILTKKELSFLLDLANKLNLDCLVESHTFQELEQAINSGAKIIGINNRNLKNFKVNINNFINLSRFVPEDRILVCESGVFSDDDVLKVKLANADAILVGTSLMTSSNISKKIKELKI